MDENLSFKFGFRLNYEFETHSKLDLKLQTQAKTQF
jgi:hypothetical protein